MDTNSRSHIRRTVPLRVKLSPEMAQRLEGIARPRGVTAATLGALIVGEYVDRTERASAIAHSAAGGISEVA